MAQRGVLRRAAIAMSVASRNGQATARGTLDVDGGIVQLATPRDGVVRDVLVVEGQSVRRDDALAVIDDRAAAIQATIAAAQLAERKASVTAQKGRAASARRERDRVAPLSKVGAVSQKRFNDAQDDLVAQDAELAQREAAAATGEGQLRLAIFEKNVRTIRAPKDGMIVRRLVQVGEGVSRAGRPRSVRNAAARTPSNAQAEANKEKECESRAYAGTVWAVRFAHERGRHHNLLSSRMREADHRMDATNAQTARQIALPPPGPGDGPRDGVGSPYRTGLTSLCETSGSRGSGRSLGGCLS